MILPLWSALGIKVKMIAGSPYNIKITTPEDLLLAQSILFGIVFP
jgi:2-C-methyl-D-erythritol 4-phosphate cytidylyltransferase